MPVLFPGMNPYLEHPDLWPEVHRRFIKALADLLVAKLPNQYEVAIRKRIYRVSGEDALVVGQPNALTPSPPLQSHLPYAAQLTTTATYVNDGPSYSNGYGNGHHQGVGVAMRMTQPIPVYVPIPQEVREDYLEVIEPEAGEVITVIEVMTPKKKRTGRGRSIYEQHRESILGSPAHFIEIDLLRGWEPLAVYGPNSETDYRMLVSLSEQRPKADLYAWNVNEPMPLFQLPLRSAKEALVIDLKQPLDKAYERSGYDLVIDYRREPLPPLREGETEWLSQFLRQLGLR